MYDRDSGVLSHRQSLVQLWYGVDLAPGDLIPVHVPRTHRSDVGKPRRECASHEAQYAAGGRATDRRLHHSRCGRRVDIDRTLSLEQRPQPTLKTLEQLLERRPAMCNHWL